MDFSKAFDAVCQKILIEKLMKHGLDEQTGSWIENCLNGRAQRVVISGIKSSWKPVTRGVTSGSILGLILFNVFINDLDDGAACTLSKSADVTKPGGMTGTPEGHAALQRDHHRLEKGADRNLLQFNKKRSGGPASGEEQPCAPVYAGGQ